MIGQLNDEGSGFWEVEFGELLVGKETRGMYHVAMMIGLIVCGFFLFTCAQ